MKFLRITITSFARFVQPFTLELDGRGLILVEGKNGAGKSMMFEAIRWCLFGKMSRYGDERIGSDEVTWNGHPADVRVWFENDKGVFEVRRWRAVGGSPHVSIKDGNGKPVKGTGVHADDATESLTNLLGFDYATLRYALTLEGTSLDLASSGFAQQMKILESILRFDVYTEAAKLAKSAAASIRAEVDVLVNEMERQELVLRQARGSKAEIESMNEEAREQELDILIGSLTVAVQELPKIEKQYERAQALLSQCDKEKIATGATLGNESKHLYRLKNLKSGDACPSCEQEVDALHLAYIVSVSAKAVDELQTAYNLCAEKSTKADERYNTLHDSLLDLKDKKRELEQAEKELADVQKRKEKRLSLIAAHDQRATEAETRLAELTDEVAVARRVHKHNEGWATRDYQALKERTLTLAAPVLNEAAARYAETLSHSTITVTFDPNRESKSEKLIRASGETGPDYDSMSNGEKRRVQIITALALRDLARWRLGSPINFQVFDEVFDALDEDGLRGMTEVLQRDVDEIGSVFLITHNDSLKTLFPGTRVMRVVKENGESRLFQ
jgi:DNA repair exonuclease SbcCD ATPase subunit